MNVTLTGATPRALGKVANAGACGPTGGWYYDDDANPRRIVLCPAACESAQESVRAMGGVQVQFGCQTVPG